MPSAGRVRLVEITGSLKKLGADVTLWLVQRLFGRILSRVGATHYVAGWVEKWKNSP